MYLNFDHFKFANKDKIEYNFRNSLTKLSKINSNSTMSQIDGNNINFSNITQEQIQQLSKLLNIPSVDNTKKSSDNPTPSSSSKTNELLRQLLTEPDPLRLNCKSAKQRSMHPWSKNLSFFSLEIIMILKIKRCIS